MKKKIQILGLTLCGLLAVGGGAVAIENMQTATASMQLIVPQEYAFESEYGYGETLVVPSPESVRIKTGLVETTAVDVVLEMPDGSAKGAGSYVLDKTGEYSLTYYNASGASATETFTVYKNAYTVEGGMPAEYVENLVGQTDKKGIEVTLKDGYSFDYNRTINLNDYAGEELEVCKIFPMFRENKDSAPSAATVSIKVVDCYDSSKFVEFYVWCASSNEVYYVGSGASTQGLTGLEHNLKRPHIMNEEYEGTMYKIHRPTRYQSNAVWGSGVRSRCNADLLQYDGLSLVWDLSNHKTSVRYSGGSVFVTDLDSAEIYDANVLDYGSFFTTGEVYLEIEAYNYTSNTFEFGVERIFGVGGTALKDGKLIDKSAPDVLVDVEATENNTVYLEKGKSVTLPMPKGVFDINYYGDMRVEVYRNYGKYGQTLAYVQDGKFTPESVGNYTAVYTATDSYGNEGKYLLNLVVLDQPNMVYQPITLEKLVAAKGNVLPLLDVVGLNKEVASRVFVTTPAGVKVELEQNLVNGYEYIPEYTGEYTVTYLLKDNVYEEEYSVLVNCVDENSATFKNPFTLPNALMKGAAYTIRPVTAYTAGNGAFNENVAEVSVSVDGGAYKALTAAQMQEYRVEADQTVQLKASYGDNFVESELYKVVDVGYGKRTTEKNYANYFQGNYDSSALAANGIEYEFNGDASLQFINAVSSAKFKLSFALEGSAKSVSVTLRELYAPKNNYVVYTYTVGADENVMMNAKQYEDGKLVLDKTVLTKYNGLCGAFDLSYSVEGMDSDGIVVSGVKAFATDGALLDICVSGATEGCKVSVSKINTQNFTASMRESKPQLAITDSDGKKEINSTYQILPCSATAVLSSVLTKDVTVSVHTPDGEVAVAMDGTKLDKVTADRVYDLKLSQAGQYRVVYEAACVGSTRNNAQEVLTNDDYYIINVGEGIPPVIKFNDGSNTSTTVNVKLGATHTVKEFTVTDNLSSGDQITVYTMILGEGFTMEENGYNVKSYVFKNAGEFMVYVLAFDELGNSSSLYYNVVVA